MRHHTTHIFITLSHLCAFFFFFFNDTATTEIYTLSLHDALPISRARFPTKSWSRKSPNSCSSTSKTNRREGHARSEEHTSELQSRQYLVCRLLLEKKKKAHMSRQS